MNAVATIHEPRRHGPKRRVDYERVHELASPPYNWNDAAIARDQQCGAAYIRLILKGKVGVPTGGQSRLAPQSVLGKPSSGMPPIDQPAIMAGRSLFFADVKDPDTSETIFKSGYHNAKIGKVITKGPWKGSEIYTLALEERATCPTSCRHWRSCVVPGTKVLTADLRWLPIETFSVGQKIVGFDEDADEETGRRSTRIATVEAIGREIRPCVKVTTDRGEIIASADHLWLAKQNRDGYDWFKSSELRAGDLIVYLTQPWDEDRSYEGGRLRGFVEGEGHLSTWDNAGFAKTRLGWSQLPGQLLNEINDIARAKGFDLILRDVVSGCRQSAITLVELGGGWRDTMKFMGMFRPSRLMNRVEDLIRDRVVNGRGSAPAKVLSIEPVGDREVVPIATSTKTLITDGYFSHNCYGNNMHLAHRFRHGPALEARIVKDVADLCDRHPDGVAIRLHTLGDFYSERYVDLWAFLIKHHQNLRVFGFSARWHADEDPVARALIKLVMERWDRFAIRFSDAPIDECATVSIEHPVQKPTDAVICPQQMQKTQSCGTCGFCWHSKKRVAFITH